MSVLHEEPRRAQGVSAEVGAELYALIERFYPICRSITGDGVRETLRIVAEHVPLSITEVPTGTPVFDWEVPKEWNVRDAFICDPKGQRIVDFRRHNLHLVSYSAPVRATLDLEELKPHLHSLPDRPDWIPYRTSYWKETWGFCLPHRQLLGLTPGRYEVCVDTTLAEGSLTYAECLVEGGSTEEVLLFTHVCHPSLCNDNASGMAMATMLARHLMARPQRRYSYRIVWAPGTIGSLTWLSRNEDTARRMRYGLVMTGFGDPGGFTYKRSRRGDAAIDRIASHVLTRRKAGATIVDFSPYGYDERQFCSPGFDLPVGRLSRQPYGSYPEYHTSADDLGFVKPERLFEAFTVCVNMVDVIESDHRYVNTAPKGEPRLGKRGLFRATGGAGVSDREEAILWMLNQSDGGRSVLDIAERSGLDHAVLAAASVDLLECGLLRVAE
jgi:aminopeptidase-like protein